MMINFGDRIPEIYHEACDSMPKSSLLNMNLPLKIKFHLPKFQETLEKMTSISYEVLGKESSRLLRQQKELLEDSLGINNLFDEHRTGAQKSFNFKEAKESIKELENELDKLETMETVIAVVGTMKAGKSTTINAIVGKEILPNRNDPMTTLPTLIRNKHGQAEPILTLNNTQPLTDLTKEISEKLIDIKNKSALTETNPSMYGTKDGKELIALLIKDHQYNFQASYQGQDAIFKFLKHLNDVTRLAKELQLSVDAVYESYQETKDLPVIEVEFCHLQAMEKSAKGNLSILDTPGPNEFGQSEALKNVFLHQLKRATAVMLVIDYTQMRSEAESGVREQIDEIKEQLGKERLSVLVNKFDNSNSTAMQKEDVQEYVANTLMGDSSLKQRIFPVSAYRAYLANRTLNYLTTENKLPTVIEGQKSWFTDFGEKALGELWDTFCSDINMVTKAANSSWEKSFFQEPLDNVIKDSHANAARFCVAAAVAKLECIQEVFSNTVTIRHTALDKEIIKIQQAIDVLAENIRNLESLKDEIQDTFDKGIVKFKADLDIELKVYNDFLTSFFAEFFEQALNKAEKKLTIEADNDFKEAQRKKKLTERWELERTSDEKKELLVKIQGILKEYQKTKELGVIKFFDEKDANAFLKTINEELREPIKSYSRMFFHIYNTGIQVLSGDIEDAIDIKTKEALDTAKRKLGGFGFDLFLTTPAMRFSEDDIILNEMSCNAYESQSTEESARRRKSGVIGTVCEWFGTEEFGWESYTYTKKHHLVNVSKIYSNIEAACINVYEQFNDAFSEYLKITLHPEIDKQLADLVSYLDAYKGVLIDGEQSQKHLEKDESEKLKAQLQIVKERASIQKKDLGVLNKALDETGACGE